MKHYANPDFWDCYNRLPLSVQQLADKSFKILKDNSEHPSLHLKIVGKYWSVRVGNRYRALAVEVEKGFLWLEKVFIWRDIKIILMTRW